LKKRIKIIVLQLVSIILFLNLTNSLAAFTSIVELDYEYDVVESELNIQYGTLSTSSTGIFIGETNHPVGSKYAVHITSDVAHEIDYTITIGEDSVTATDIPNNNTILDLLFLPTYFAEINDSWDQTIFDKGTPKIFNTHFFDLSIINPTFEYLDEDGHLLIPNSPFDFGGGSFLCRFDVEGSKGIFEWGFTRRIYETISWGVEVLILTGYYDFLIEYDLTTGVLNGYHLKFDYNGTRDGKILDFYMDQHVEAVGYKMERLRWDEGVPGFEFLIAIPALFIVSTISLYINKKRKKKLN